MKRSYNLIGALISAALLAACGGGSSTPTGTQVAEQVASGSRLRSPAMVSCSTSACIYATNAAGFKGSRHNAVRVFLSSANGNAHPKLSIKGSSTGLHICYNIAVDSSRNIYVSNSGGSQLGVTVYAAGASGNVAPIQNINGPSTGMNGGPAGVAVDSSDNIYVATVNPGSVYVFAAGATGNATPIQTISGGNTGLNRPWGVAVDSSQNIYVANPSGNSVTVYAAGANGNVTPIQTISGGNTGLDQPRGLAIDGDRNIYVMNRGGGVSGGPSVTVFAAGANGNVAPIQTISGNNTLLGGIGIAVDASDKIYVSAGPSVAVYAAGANGNVVPIQTIQGNTTHLTSAVGVAVR